jgi:hypothetical protein
MPAYLEPLTLVLRAGPEAESYPQPYTFSCTAIVRGEEAELIGGSGHFEPAWRRDVARALRAYGVKRVYWDRRGRKERRVETVT